MTRVFLFISGAMFLLPNVSQASSDGCEYGPVLEYERLDLSPCNQDLPFLEPSNDSRGNMSLLFDAYLNSKKASTVETSESNVAPPTENIDDWSKLGKLVEELFPDPATRPNFPEVRPSSYGGYDFGDVRATNNPSRAIELLLAARNASPIPNVQDLAQRSIKLLTSSEGDCKLDDNGLSAGSSDFSKYQSAAAALYCLKYSAASEKFCALTEASDPWVREAATYTCARATLLQAQEKWDGYEIASKAVDKAVAELAHKRLEHYLSAFPGGTYSSSANGLLRRADYFLDNWPKYLGSISIEFNLSTENGDIDFASELADEFDHYGLAAFYRGNQLASHPLLAADIFLLALRKNPEPSVIVEISNRNKSDFAEYPGLLELIQATAALKTGQLEEAARHDVALTLPPEVRLGRLDIAAAANEKLQKWDEAIKLRREIVAIGTELWPPHPYQDETAEKLPMEQYQSLMNSGEFSENDNFYPIPLERLKIGLARNYLRAKRPIDLLRLPASDVPKWAIQAIIQQGFTEVLLKTAQEDKSMPAYVRDSAARTLMRIFIAGDRFTEADELYRKLSERVRIEFKGIGTVLSNLKASDPELKSLIQLADFKIDDQWKAGDFSALASRNDSFTSDLPRENLRTAASTQDKREPIRLFEAAMLEARKQKLAEIEAEATAKLLNCFRNGSWGWSCNGLAAGEYLKKYPEDARKALFRRLKKELGKTVAGSEQKYWF